MVSVIRKFLKQDYILLDQDFRMNHSPVMLVREAENNPVIIHIYLDSRDRKNLMNGVHILPFGSDHSNLDTKKLTQGHKVMVVTPYVNAFVCF